jgi:hypothetical protein
MEMPYLHTMSDIKRHLFFYLLSIDAIDMSIFIILIHTYHSRFNPEGAAAVSQIFLRDTHVLPKHC